MDESQRQDVAAQVAEARKARKWTQEELAAAAGISERTVRNIEAGRITPQAGKLGRVMDVLGLVPGRRKDDRFTPEVQVCLDVVGAWLMALPSEARMTAIRRLTSQIVRAPWQDDTD